jgi:DNA-binding response OmpR family regulator
MVYARRQQRGVCAVPKKILVVEDEAQIVRLVRAYLEQAGMGVTMARDGEEGLARFRQERPDLVILDLMLRAHGGDIGVESREGKGSTFAFTLPG